MNTKELIRVLDATPSSQNILLLGKHGIGKSEILTEYYTTRGMRVVVLFLGQMADPGDLIGLPQQKEGRTEFLPPYWFPKENEPIVLFLDELNRARPEMLQAVMDLALNRTLAGHRLPVGSRVIAACNEGDDYQLTDMDPALVSRFNTYRFQPTAAEWLLWAERKGLDARVVGFIRNEPQWLQDPRAWTRLAETIAPLKNLTDEDAPLMSGIVPIAAVARLLSFVNGKHDLTGQDVLERYEQVGRELMTYPLHKLALVNENVFQMLQLLEGQHDERYAHNLEAYVNDLEHQGEKESLAHLANLFEQGTYDQAVLFIMQQAPRVYAKLMKFVKELA